jgi:hypothetical protein
MAQTKKNLQVGKIRSWLNTPTSNKDGTTAIIRQGTFSCKGLPKVCWWGMFHWYSCYATTCINQTTPDVVFCGEMPEL